jgi:replicative DNA helicase
MSARESVEQVLSAERSVLGALLLDGAAFERIADVLVHEDFSLLPHRALFKAIQGIFDRGQPIDAITAWEALGRPVNGSEGLGLAYLSSLATNTPSAANIGRYAEIVRQYALLRRVGQIGADLAASAGRGGDPHELAATAESDLLRALDRSAGDPVLIGEAVWEAMQYADERQQAGGGMSGIATGLQGFDRYTNGLEPGQLLIVAARPSVGKTALACSMASAMSEAGKVGLFVTLEMSRREIGQRILALRSEVSTHAMRAVTSDDRHWSDMTRAYEGIQDEKVYVDDTPAVTVGYLRAKGRRLKRKAGLDFIVVDYIGLMRGTGENRVQELGSVNRGLKALAKELSVPIIALAQLNRGVEARHDRRPILSDLRDSGEIEQDADIVAMLHREEKHSDAPEWVGLAELLVRKNRNGPTGDCLLAFDEETGAFRDSNALNPRTAATARRRFQASATGGFDE